DHPYLARNPSDFWRRWNISLSTWFRDYVYVPLGGSREGELKWARNVLVTFLLSGLWHGASWNYVLWGLYHGVLLLLTRAHELLRPPPPLRGYGETDSLGTGAKTAGPRRHARGPGQSSRLVAVVTVAAMFVLTLFGWLLF